MTVHQQWMRLRHGLVWHQWRQVGPIQPDDEGEGCGITYDRCDWCGATRPTAEGGQA